ncbi:MAG TPA: DUF1844 domain-containing protein [Thermodesulfobacteriota bacterium]
MAPREETESFKVVDRRRFTAEGDAVPSAQAEAAQDRPAAEPRRPEAPRDEPERPRGAPRPGDAGPGAELPPPTFAALVQMLAMSALDALGAIPGPDGERRPPDLALARHGIDLLGVLEAKTRGNLEPDEARLLEQTLFDLRMLAVRAGSARG